MDRRRWIAMLACVGALGLALAGCAKPGSGQLVGGDVTGSPSSVPSGPPGVTPPVFTPTAGVPPTGKGPAMTLRGEVIEGVESGCMLLRADDGKDYLLLYGDRALIAQGGRLEVSGEVRTDMVTTCQQGIPFVVTSTRRA